MSEALRGQGTGRALLVAAEEEAKRRGCRTIALQTHDFQAPDFSPKYGYEIVGATTDTPVGYPRTAVAEGALSRVQIVNAIARLPRHDA